MGLINDLEHVARVCKLGQFQRCCRYLLTSSKGFECAKINSSHGPVQSLAEKMAGQTATMTVKEYLDKRVETGTITARGDNCEGR